MFCTILGDDPGILLNFIKTSLTAFSSSLLIKNVAIFDPLENQYTCKCILANETLTLKMF